MFDDDLPRGCLSILLILVIVVFVLSVLPLFPEGRTFWNRWDYNLKKVDETTKYENVKYVYDTAYATVAQYAKNKAVWEQYKDKTDEFSIQLANGAKMQANNAAATYTLYMKQNDFLWKENMPDDLPDYLPEIK